MTSNIHKRVVELVPLSEKELGELANQGVTETDDLMLFNDDDWDTMNVTSIKKLKALQLVSSFLRCGGKFEDTTSILDMVNLVKEKSNNSSTVQNNMAVVTPKIEANFIKAYDGDLLEWEVWERETENTLGQYHRDKYMSTPQVPKVSKPRTSSFILHWLML